MGRKKNYIEMFSSFTEPFNCILCLQIFWRTFRKTRVYCRVLPSSLCRASVVLSPVTEVSRGCQLSLYSAPL